MAGTGRVVAELGRPETPAETAARKAESSRVHRSSQTFRNLIAALLVILAVVAVVVLIVPRGGFDTDSRVDVPAVAREASQAYDRTVIVPQVPAGWRANAAKMTDEGTPAFTVVYATDEASGFLRIAQGFDADASWEARLLSGAGADGTVSIDGIEWTRYHIADPGSAGNVTYAIGTDAGADRILVYGAADADTAATAARGLTDQIRTLRKEAQ